MLKTLAIHLIAIDGGTQSRKEIHETTVAEYCDLWERGTDLPPLEVFFDGSDYWLADGFHRLISAQRAKRDSVSCEVHNGTKRDAILFAVGANASHGLRRSNDDKRHAVEMLLNDSEWVTWSDRAIAEKAAVSVQFVATVRKQLSTVDGSPAAQQADKPRIGRDGKARSPQLSAGKKAEALDSLPKPLKEAVLDGKVKATDKAVKALAKAEPAKQAEVARIVRTEGKSLDEAMGLKAPKEEPIKSARTEFDPAKIEAEANAGKVNDDGTPDIESLAKDYAAALNHLTQVKRLITPHSKHERTGGYLAPLFQSFLTDLDRCFSYVSMLTPTKLCHKCKGVGCGYCHNTGFLTKQAVQSLAK